MAKKEQMLRLMNIANFLKSRPKGATYIEVERYLDEKSYQDSYENLAFSEKTFQRDRKLLDDLFGIEIKYNPSSRKYHIVNDHDFEATQTIFDNLLMINAYKKTSEHADIMHFEKRQASGFHHLDGLIYAIKNCKIIECNYTKYLSGKPEKRTLEPYALKECKNRWYVIAKDYGASDFVLKTFGLDRISDLEIRKSSFQKMQCNIEEMFKNSFGIVSTLGQKPSKITISFDPWQGMYVKSLPLHSSQKVLVDHDKEFTIELTLVPTYDFYQELLTHSERILSLEPKEVKTEFSTFLKRALKHLDS